MSSHPFRYARVPAVLGVLGVAVLFPSVAGAQGSVQPSPLPDPAFQKHATADSLNGPIRFLLHGRFGSTVRQGIVGVSPSGTTSAGTGGRPSVALFGEVGDGYARVAAIDIEGMTPTAATAGDVTDSGQESVVVAAHNGVDGGTIEFFNWHDGPRHRSLPIPYYPTSVAVGRFVPGRGPVIAASMSGGGGVQLYAVDNAGSIQPLGQVAGVPAGPLAVARRRDGNGDALLAPASDGTAGARYEVSLTGNSSAPYASVQAGTTSRPFGKSADRIAQDTDAYGNRWYTTPGSGVTELSWFYTGGLEGIGENGPFLRSPMQIGRPVALDLYGRRKRDVVAALDGYVPFRSGTEAAAIDVDDDHRDDLAIADGPKVTLYRNVTALAAPALEDGALTPSVRNAAEQIQVVTSHAFDVTVPSTAGEEYACSIGDGAWTACTGGAAGPALHVPSDGGYTLNVRRKLTGTDSWSPEQHISFVVKTEAPADPTFYASPDAYTRYPYFAITPHDGVRFEYRLGSDGDWTPVDGQTFDLRDLVDGPYRVTVRAVSEMLGTASKGVDVDFVLDTKAPAAPVVLTGPAETTSLRTATFAFASADPDASYECLVDMVEPLGGDPIPWQPCGTPFVVGDLALGEHTLTVRQVDKAGNHSRSVVHTWTVVAPTPDKQVIVTPKPSVVEQPATPRPPAAEAAKPAAPKPAVDKPEESKPVAAKLAVGAPAGKGKTPVATSTGRRVAVGCAAPGAEDYRCAVTVTRNGKTVGEGRRTGAGIVPVNLDKATARKVQRLGGLKVRVTLTVKTEDGETSKTQKTVRILPKKVLVVPTDGLFAFDSARPSKGADALAKQIAGQLDGARTITIVGHTDAKGTADVNRRLGRQRAEAFRRLLAEHGFRGKVAVESAGDTQPRASNATDAGRALNRRVEIDVRY